MLKNYFLIAWRNLRRHLGYTLLNLIGLTVGITASLLILLFLFQQLAFDRHHERADRIHRISSAIAEPDDAFRWAVTQSPLGPELQRRFPEVEEAVRFIENGRTEFRREEQTFFAEDVFVVDSNVFAIFTFDFLAGNPLTALNDPSGLVLSQSLAERCFGTTDLPALIGRTLEINGREEPSRITGIYADMPKTSHLIASALLPIRDTEGQMEAAQAWGGFYLYTYALLKSGTDPAAFEQKLAQLDTLFIQPIFDQFEVDVEYETIALTDIHLKSDFEGEPEPTGSVAYLYIFGSIGLFMLLIACINYMNLATARSARRAREVGIRKVMGSSRGALILQFLTESALMALLALGVSLLLVRLSLPFFNQILDLPLAFGNLWQTEVVLGMIGILLLTGLLAGSYPAFFLSAFQPVAVLKGAAGKTTGGNRRLRQVLVVLQFAISLFMLISTGIVYDQLQFLRQTDLGFTDSPVIRFNLNQDEDRQKWPVLRQALLNVPGVESAATTGSAPGQGYGKNLMPLETNDGNMEEKGVNLFSVDFDYLSTMEMNLTTGRDFDRSMPTDSTLAVVINEAMVARMGWTDPVGKKVQMNLEEGATIAQVIGVIEDYHHQSLYDLIEPMLLFYRPNNRTAVLRISANNLEGTLQAVEQAWTEVFPNKPFEYDFQDEAFMEQYEADRHRSQLFSLFSGLTILIACLGLLGLASFTAEQRTKEIGIRKVVGASTQNLMLLLTREFVVLVLLATPLAFGAAWWFMQDWLAGFAYHAPMSFWTYLSALLLTVVITLGTTSWHAYRAATLNPADALRAE